MKLELIKQTLEVSNFDEAKKVAILKQIEMEMNGPMNPDEIHANVEDFVSNDSKMIFPRNSNKFNALTFKPQNIYNNQEIIKVVKFEKNSDVPVTVSESRNLVDNEKDSILNSNYVNNNSEISLVK